MSGVGEGGQRLWDEVDGVKWGAVSRDKVKHIKLECGPMPNVMAALPNIVGAVCSTPQSLADTHY